MSVRVAVLGLFLASACVPEGDAKRDKPAGQTAQAKPPAVPSKPLGPPDPLLTAPFTDNFDRKDLGMAWNATSQVWRIQDGRLCGRNAKNHGAWLKRRLPVNARIEFDATSASPQGDLKVEVWGDGRSHATGVSYTNATSYVVIFGGWKNSFHVLARIDEHAPNRPEVKLDPTSSDVRTAPVKANQTYRFSIERNDGKTVRWSVDGAEVISFADPQPLVGEKHQYFGFNNWEVPVCFDNLSITPLEGS